MLSLASQARTPNAQTGLPDYAPLLAAFHEEFAPELKAIVRRLPLSPAARVLDVACGDGQFAIWFAQRVNSVESVTAIDASPAELKVAAKRVRDQRCKGVQLRQADARRLPFGDGNFDFVWCAQSLYCLPDLMQCLAEMVRVLKPGGTLGILEDDTLHQVLLPWPIDLELEVRAAELAAFRRESVAPARYYVGRWTARLLRRAGLTKIREHACTATRQAPLTPAAQTFFTEYLANLRRRVRPLLAPAEAKRLDRLTYPASRRFLPRQRDFTAVCLDRVVWGQKPRRMTPE